MSRVPICGLLNLNHQHYRHMPEFLSCNNVQCCIIFHQPNTDSRQLCSSNYWQSSWRLWMKPSSSQQSNKCTCPGFALIPHSIARVKVSWNWSKWAIPFNKGTPWMIWSVCPRGIDPPTSPRALYLIPICPTCSEYVSSKVVLNLFL